MAVEALSSELYYFSNSLRDLYNDCDKIYNDKSYEANEKLYNIVIKFMHNLDIKQSYYKLTNIFDYYYVYKFLIDYIDYLNNILQTKIIDIYNKYYNKFIRTYNILNIDFAFVKQELNYFNFIDSSKIYIHNEYIKISHCCYLYSRKKCLINIFSDLHKCKIVQSPSSKFQYKLIIDYSLLQVQSDSYINNLKYVKVIDEYNKLIKIPYLRVFKLKKHFNKNTITSITIIQHK